MSLFKKKESINNNVESDNSQVEENTTLSNDTIVDSNKTDNDNKIEKIEWIWVDGYKGTDENMCCRGFQYELGKTYIYDGKVELCESGYHLCSRLDDVFGYYGINSRNRFFKVKALVNKKEYDNSSKTPLYYYTSNNIMRNDSKIVAKEIRLVSELTFDDLKKYIQTQYPFIENEEEYKSNVSYNDFAKLKFIRELKNIGFSDMFALVLSEKYEINKLYSIMKHAKAYVAEGISKDMMVYLLITKYTL